MTLMDGLINSLKLTLYERVSNPLIRAFVIAWLIINYQFVIMLFMGYSDVESLVAASEVLYPHSWAYVSRMLLFPIISAMFYLLVVPYPVKMFYEHWLRSQTDLAKIKQAIEGQQLLSREKSREIRGLAQQQAEAHEKEVMEKDEEIETLKNRIKELISETNLSDPESSNNLSVIVKNAQRDGSTKNDYANKNVVKNTADRFRKKKVDMDIHRTVTYWSGLDTYNQNISYEGHLIFAVFDRLDKVVLTEEQLHDYTKLGTIDFQSALSELLGSSYIRRSSLGDISITEKGFSILREYRAIPF